MVSINVFLTSSSPFMSSHLTLYPLSTIQFSMTSVKASPFVTDFGSIGLEIDPVVHFGIEPISKFSLSSPSGPNKGFAEFQTEFCFFAISSCTSKSSKILRVFSLFSSSTC